MLGFAMYVALSFVTIYFNAAVIGTATKRLRGEDAKISDGLALARQHIGTVFVWALITATVGMILRQLQERAGLLGRIVLGLVGNATIGLAIFLVGIPIVVIGGLVAAAAPVIGIPLLVVAIGGLMAIGAACSGVFNAALHRYATTGEASGAFSVDDMNASFHPRRGRHGAGPAGFTGRGFD